MLDELRFVFGASYITIGRCIPTLDVGVYIVGKFISPAEFS